MRYLPRTSLPRAPPSLVGVLLDPETTKPIRQTTRAFQWLDVPLYFLLVADRCASDVYWC